MHSGWTAAKSARLSDGTDMKDAFGVSKAYYEEHDPVVRAIKDAQGHAAELGAMARKPAKIVRKVPKGKVAAMVGAGTAVGVGTGFAAGRVKKDYSSAVDRSLTHRRKATRRLQGAEAAEAIGGLGGAAAVFIPAAARKKASNKVFTPAYAKAQTNRGLAEMAEDVKGAAKWGKRERLVARAARTAAHPATLPVAILGGGLATGVGLRVSAARHNAKSNKIARAHNRDKDSRKRVAVVGLGTKTRY